MRGTQASGQNRVRSGLNILEKDRVRPLSQAQTLHVFPGMSPQHVTICPGHGLFFLE